MKIKIPREEKMSSSLLDGIEILQSINEKSFVVAKKTGFPFYPEEVEEVLGTFFQ